MHQHNAIRRVATCAVATATSLVAITACGAPSGGSSIAHAEQVAASCSTDGGQIAARVDSDESGTSRGETTNPARQQVIATLFADGGEQTPSGTRLRRTTKGGDSPSDT